MVWEWGWAKTMFARETAKWGPKSARLETDFAYICNIKQAPCIVANDYDTAAANDDGGDGDDEKKTRRFCLPTNQDGGIRINGYEKKN